MLKNVTITGVDDKTNLVDLMDLSIKYPFTTRNLPLVASQPVVERIVPESKIKLFNAKNATEFPL